MGPRRIRRMASVMAFVLTLAACGSDGVTPAVTTETTPVTTSAASSTTAPVSMAPATTATTTTILTTTAPAGPATTLPLEDVRLLRADGIGPFDFGSEMSAVVQWMTERLGPPQLADAGEEPDIPGSVPNSLLVVCGSETVAHWPAAALDLYFTESQFDDGNLLGCTGTMRLVAWGVGSYVNDDPISPAVRLVTVDGIGVGSTVTTLRELDTVLGFMQWSGDDLYPAGFFLGPGGWPFHLFGVLAWDWVRDLQRALNEHGFDLAVDGQLGPRTRSALDVYRQQQDLPTGEDAILQLELEPSGDVPVIVLAAGRWNFEFECGPLGWNC